MHRHTGSLPVTKLIGGRDVGLRPVAAADEPFLRALDATVVAQLLGLDAMPEEVRAPLVELQFTARHRDREARFPDAEHQLILLDDAPVGELIVDRRPGSFLVVDIALVPAARRQGIGSAVLAALAASADAAGCSVRATARPENAASRRMFAAAGFVEAGDDGLDVTLERPARSGPPGPGPGAT